METQRKRHSFVDMELVFFLVLIGIAAVFFFTSLDYPRTMGMFPRMMSVIMMVLGVVVVIRKYAGRSEATAAQHVCKGTRWYVVYAFAVGYIGLVLLLGFAAGTFLVCAALPPLLGYRRWLVVGVFAACTTLVVYWLCTSVFMLRLPAGLLFA